jgi:3'-phosphoadenosine 5'-phosphosulfate sulfotransferase (PAPS reductase)/FAD synthetase
MFLLTFLGLVANPSDTCVMHLSAGADFTLLAIYVDDLLLFTITLELADEITAKLKAKFNCVDLGEITWCLGMGIRSSADRHTITLDLEQYLTTIVTRYEFSEPVHAHPDAA